MKKALVRLLQIIVVLSLSLGIAIPRQPVRAASFDCASVTEIPTIECLALVALYNSADGAHWYQYTNWFVPDRPIGGWYGIRVNEGHVMEVVLPNNNLVGTIPPELGNLSGMETLNLAGNNLSGNIPPQLGNLAKLQILALGGNQISGSIPPELGNLSKVEYILLGGNLLTGPIPPELGKLNRYLSSLLLNDNHLTGSIPPELGNMMYLVELGLYDNQLSGSIPPQMGNMASLQSLNLSHNQLSGNIPPQLSYLQQYMTAISLDHNQLSGSIPPELGNLINLSAIDLEDNQLSGSIPPQLGNLKHLFRLQLQNNQLTGSIPPQLGDMEQLNALYLDHNHLQGSIPPELTRLTHICNMDKTYWNDCLSLENNWLTVPNPYPSVPPTLLDTFLMQKDPGWETTQGCAVVSEIPQSECNALAVLYNEHGGLDWSKNANWLTSYTPSDWSGVTVVNGHVTALDLHNNHLFGQIPPELGNMTSLTFLDLSQNQLMGKIPAELVNLTQISDATVGNQFLNLGENQLDVPNPYPSDPPTALDTYLMAKDPNWAKAQTHPLFLPILTRP